MAGGQDDKFGTAVRTEDGRQVDGHPKSLFGSHSGHSHLGEPDARDSRVVVEGTDVSVSNLEDDPADDPVGQLNYLTGYRP